MLTSSSPFLLVACSKSKLDYPAEARYFYTGLLTQLGMAYGERYGYRVLLLSAKHGWIFPWTVVEPYDTRLSRHKGWRGVWPVGEGFYVGGQTYFKHAPARFQPLVPHAVHLGIKVWISELQRML